MSDLALGEDGDLVVTNGDLALVDGVDAVTQFVSQRLKFFRGEWFLDTLAGLPYYDDVFIKDPQAVILDGIFKDVILGTPGILGLEEFSLVIDAASRTMNLNFKARSTEGVVDFNQEDISI